MGSGEEIRRQIWEDSVVGADDSFEDRPMGAKLLNTTVARRAITKAGRMDAAGELHLWGFPWGFP